jgi:hypothetical protein
MFLRILAVVLAIVWAGTAVAEDEKTISCNLNFSMVAWAALIKSGSGEGRITCTNGDEIEVTLKSGGIGLAAGKIEITNGHGEFSAVRNVDDLFGTYSGASRAGGVGTTAGGAAGLVKGDVALGLYGSGHGIGISSFGASGLTIERKE